MLLLGAFLAANRDQRLGPLPLIVYGDGSGNGNWNRLADACTLRHVDSPERLLDLAMLFTHRNVAQLGEDKRGMLERLHESDQVLAGKDGVLDGRNDGVVVAHHARKHRPAGGQPLQQV